MNVYPNGAPIPEVLPESYQPSSYGNTPAGQSCFTCKNFNLANRYCSAWKAPVKPRWWCEGWASGIVVSQSNAVSSALLKKITTNTVEEHFTQVSNLKPKQFGYENEEDVIKLNVPIMLRILEWAREDAQKDCDLHIIVERLIELSEEGDTLTMDDYPEVVYQDTEVEKGK